MCSGMEVEDANGVVSTVWPMIYAMVTDWQEGCVAAGTKSGNQTNCPCHTCLVLASQLNDLSAGRQALFRTEERMKEVYDQVVLLHSEGQPGANAVIESLLKGWSVNPVQVSYSTSKPIGHPSRAPSYSYCALPVLHEAENSCRNSSMIVCRQVASFCTRCNLLYPLQARWELPVLVTV
jgi:hypothetical protein